MAEKRVTLEEVLAARTPRGGWTKKQLEEWGIHWPPKTGWIKRLTGDLNASVPMPGRTAVAMQLARKTRLELEQENLRLRAALERLLLEFDFMIESGIIPDVRNDIIFVEARAALEGK